VETHCDFLIVGAGVAGLSLAIQLQDAGKSIVVIDKQGVAAGASGVPLGLINPAAAKNANLSWNAIECMDAITRLLNRASSYADQPFFKKAGILRPASDSKTLEAYRKNVDLGNYPDGWVRWMDDTALSTFNTEIIHAGAGLFVDEGYTVDMTAYLMALNRMLEPSGAKVITQINIRNSEQTHDGNWLVELSDGTTLITNSIIYCNGSGIIDTPEWSWLPVHQIKGQMARYRSKTPIDWDYSISGRGYIAHLNGQDWVVGSTFEHHFDHSGVDHAGLEYLENKVDTILPNLRNRSTLVDQWTGVRLGTPNRLPIIGRHPSLFGHWVFAGLGSKGLMYSAWLAELLTKVMLGTGDDIPFDVDVARFRDKFTEG